MTQQSAKTTTYLPQHPIQDVVILVHGLTRSSRSMIKIRKALQKRGFGVVCLDYPSRSAPIIQLAEEGISAALQAAHEIKDNLQPHFVTHSLGAILLRVYLERHPHAPLGNTVMIAPPNQGSEVVDRLKRVPGFRLINGPAGLELGTAQNSIPQGLGPVTSTVGIIAGVKSVNPLLSLLLPKPNDGKVALGSTKVEGMSDFLVVNASHTFILDKREVIDQTLMFLRQGQFNHANDT